jgi:uncharacterized protein (DUF2062 family)
MVNETITHVGPPLPGPLHRLKRWLAAHHMTLMTLTDTPHSIALGSAIGIFFGFTPLLSMKTLLSIAVAWLCKCNKIAAAIAVTLHDIILPLMPAIYLWQYKIGMRLLYGRPDHRVVFQLGFADFTSWKAFLRVGWPLLFGSLFLAVPCAIATYLIMRMLVSRARSDRQGSSADSSS